MFTSNIEDFRKENINIKEEFKDLKIEHYILKIWLHEISNTVKKGTVITSRITWNEKVKIRAARKVKYKRRSHNAHKKIENTVIIKWSRQNIKEFFDTSTTRI